jgi:hypothetical protein
VTFLLACQILAFMLGAVTALYAWLRRHEPERVYMGLLAMSFVLVAARRLVALSPIERGPEIEAFLLTVISAMQAFAIRGRDA